MHLLSLARWTPEQICASINKARYFKHRLRNQLPVPQTCQGKTLALIFSKRSTRTRLAAETSFSQLGGHPMFLGSADIQMGVNESLEDTVRVVSSMSDALMLRMGPHEDIEKVAKYSSVPVVNALTDRYHPTQILADLLTIHESFGSSSANEMNIKSLRGLSVAWIGDCNNVLHSTLIAYSRLGIQVRVARPRWYELESEVVQELKRLKSETRDFVDPIWTHDPEEAVKGVDVVMTDTWVSMGQEEEKKKRLQDFAGFQVSHQMLTTANPNWKFMHCLPRKPEEVTDEVFYDAKRSLVFEEAENRKYTIMSVFDMLVGRHT